MVHEGIEIGGARSCHHGSGRSNRAASVASDRAASAAITSHAVAASLTIAQRMVGDSGG